MDGDGAGKEENKRRNGFGPNDKLAHAATKGKLLTTPSRLFKLLIPLPTNHQKDVEAIAILVHSQQPLSYLERLIQAEVPLVKGRDGQKRPPAISFIVLQFEGDSIRPRSATHEDAKFSARSMGEVEEIALAVGPEPTELKSPSKELGTCSNLRRGKPDPESADERYVRWSHATEIGDFIRDAVRAGEFIIAIEGEPAGLSQIKVTVPSFEERTYFLRMRLRKIAGRIQKLAEIKHECDILAHRGAQRVAIGGFGILASWWYLVYRLTFETDLGWDTMEPVTYLASLSTLMGGYLWFLYHNREISYRSAMDFTINARQKKLYQQKGLDLQLWESLIDEGNALRREIKTIAADYETEWNEKLDERDERVTEALRQERKQKKDDSKQEEGKRSDT
ncbi:hypothetical protein ARAM_006306 [Aspergillus rambellii]|uniref:Calcium uniporter protein n=1 Tax=Aspergillus rambellii TaxID=308745 RepID=A0A0F8UW98_9EURO|nr:hypothetical protein ARAM_006306 [Aspergillus rambellii]